MMNASELMIGDWVRLVNNPNIYLRMVDVSGTSLFRRWTSDGNIMVPYDYNEIEPIPLTPEILEKSGFTLKEDQYNHKKYFLLGKNEYNCDVYLDGLTILLVEEEYEPITYAYICDVNYVHELQHALKLCNIDKEIVV